MNKKSDWINVNNKLPKKNGRYLVFDKNDGVMIRHYNKNRRIWEADTYSDERYSDWDIITHWTFLPEGPRRL